ncbi:hypothetical protein FNV43_RR00488 [Rhamnella rubrinervis]|uniref:Uncharacterized protein n=1 Tax=Rhamnella rubrinervis TaxID=2594499 RepID=A0A8K0HNP1_9ROSA|nr:hypothetical protein FNV43_RR00488 [Rhamnella rubrinervis]
MLIHQKKEMKKQEFEIFGPPKYKSMPVLTHRKDGALSHSPVAKGSVLVVVLNRSSGVDAEGGTTNVDNGLGNLTEDGLSHEEKFIVRCYEVGLNKIATIETIANLLQDTIEAGSGAKVIDCILSLKSYHEGKQITGANGFYKYAKSPSVLHVANRMHSRASAAISSDSCRCLDMSVSCERQPTSNGDNGKLEEYFVESIGKLLAERMVGSKENIDLASYHNRDMVDPVKQFNRIMSSCLEEQPQDNFPEVERNLLGVWNLLLQSQRLKVGAMKASM